MSRTGLHRRLIALAAAYALALQALFVAFAAPPGLGLDQVICTADGHAPAGGADDRSPAPGGHAPGCPLCPLACGATLALPPVGFTVAVFVEPSAAPRLAAVPAPVTRIVARAGLARAPPA